MAGAHSPAIGSPGGDPGLQAGEESGFPRSGVGGGGSPSGGPPCGNATSQVGEPSGRGVAGGCRGCGGAGVRMVRRPLVCPPPAPVRDPAWTSRRCSARGPTAPGNRESQAALRRVARRHTANADTAAVCAIAVCAIAAGRAVTVRGGTERAVTVNLASANPCSCRWNPPRFTRGRTSSRVICPGSCAAARSSGWTPVQCSGRSWLIRPRAIDDECVQRVPLDDHSRRHPGMLDQQRPSRRPDRVGQPRCGARSYRGVAGPRPTRCAPLFRTIPSRRDPVSYRRSPEARFVQRDTFAGALSVSTGP